MSRDFVHFIATGGTIDSHYDGAIDMVVANEESIVQRFISGVKLSAAAEFSQVCLKDSRTLNDDDRKLLAKAIDDSPASTIIVTHGLYTIPETARFLEAHLRDGDKTVVLTGSLMPIDGFALSDAGFNLGYALAEARRLPAGVYVCLRGESVSAADSGAFTVPAHTESMFAT